MPISMMRLSIARAIPMKRELKACAALRRDETPPQNRKGHPDEKGTERKRGSMLGCGQKIARAIPMKRELKEDSLLSRQPFPCTIARAIPMKRELKGESRISPM